MTIHKHRTNEPTDTDEPMDSMLRERLGTESPPNLADRVVDSFLADEGRTAAARLTRAEQANMAAPRSSRRLAAAAIVLLGVGVVLAIQWLERSGKPQQSATPQVTQQPEQSVVPDTAQDPKPAIRVSHGDVALRVQDAHGGPVQVFDLVLYEVMREQPLRVNGKTGREYQRHPRDFTDDFTLLEDLPPGRYAIAVQADGHVRTVSEVFTVPEEGKGTAMTLTLSKGCSVKGRVLDANGKPLAGATVATDSQPLPGNSDGNSSWP